MIKEIIKTLSKARFNVEDEKQLQQQIHDELVKAGTMAICGFVREFRLSDGNIIDFYFPTGHDQGFGIEVKIAGTKKSMYRQLERYCKHDMLTDIILVTNKTIGLPSTINGKPTYIVKLGKAWL